MADWSGAGKFFILLGAVFVALGLMLSLLGKWPGGLSWFGRLPGDILFKRDHVTVYVPVVTSLMVSIVLSLLIYFFSRR
jgi:hypothetical protein